MSHSHHAPLPHQQVTDYQTLLEYDLQLQKDRNSILQERLRNKQIFILQMKQIQQEMNQAYAASQKQLEEARRIIEGMDRKRYAGEDADRRHRGRDHREVDAEDGMLRSHSVPFINEEQSSNQRHSSIVNTAKQLQQIPIDPKIQQFLNRFLQMVHIYHSNIGEHSNENTTTHFQIKQNMKYRTNYDNKLKVSDRKTLHGELKMAWKWIKNVVKDWDRMRNDDFDGGVSSHVDTKQNNMKGRRQR